MREHRLALGILWTVVAEIIFVTTWAAIKHLGKTLPLFEVVFFRSFISLIALIPMTLYRLRTFRGKNLLALFLRALFGYIAMFMSFYGMIHMEMGNAATLIYTVPIFVAMLAPVLIGEPFAPKQFLFILLAFVGVGFIMKPGPDMATAPALLTLMSGLMSALAMICLRKLAESDSTLIITLYFTAFATAASAPLAAMDFVVPRPADWVWIVYLGVAITFAQLFLSRAYRYGHAATITPFGYTSVLGSYIAGLVIFGEVPDAWSIAGAAVVVACGIGVILMRPRAAAVEVPRKPTT